MAACFRQRAARESIHAISFRIRVPKIILLFLYDRMPKKEVKFTRHNIFERDKNTCQYCGKVFDRSELNLDHVVPRDRGGPTTWEITRSSSARSDAAPQRTMWTGCSRRRIRSVSPKRSLGHTPVGWRVVRKKATTRGCALRPRPSQRPAAAASSSAFVWMTGRSGQSGAQPVTLAEFS